MLGDTHDVTPLGTVANLSEVLLILLPDLVVGKVIG